jgi:hypothetical protein
VEISSRSTKLRDGNTIFNLHEMKGVKYYVIAVTENKMADAFHLTPECSIDFDLYNLWQLM